jgi:SsrA-binding protein
MTAIENKKAYHNYQILEKFEAGIELKGTEVKSIKNGRVSFGEGFVEIRNQEAWLKGVNIPPFQIQNAPKNYDPLRQRKLLLHKKEINYLASKSKIKGLTIIPLKIYLKRGKIKIEIALAKGKRKYQRKEEIKKREIEREIREALKKRLSS